MHAEQEGVWSLTLCSLSQRQKMTKKDGMWQGLSGDLDTSPPQKVDNHGSTTAILGSEWHPLTRKDHR